MPDLTSESLVARIQSDGRFTHLAFLVVLQYRQHLGLRFLEGLEYELKGAHDIGRNTVFRPENEHQQRMRLNLQYVADRPRFELAVRRIRRIDETQPLVAADGER